MSEYKIVKCQNYGPTAGAGAVWFEVYELKKLLWFRIWKPINEQKSSDPHPYGSPVRFKSVEKAEECIERLQVHKPNTTVREDVPLDCRH